MLQTSAERFAGFKFDDYGDPAGNQRSAMSADKDAKTCFDILRAKGIQIQAAEQNLTIRLESVRKPLNTLTGGKPQLQVSPRCEMLRLNYSNRPPELIEEGIARLGRVAQRQQLQTAVSH